MLSERVASLRMLASMHLESEQWALAANVLEQALEAPRDDDQQDTDHLHLAWLFEEHLGQTNRALKHLRRVLEHDPQNPSACDQLARMFLRRNQLESAAYMLARLSRNLRKPKLKVRALVRLAKVEALIGRQASARWALQRALGLEGCGGEAAASYRSILGLIGDWRDYVSAIISYLNDAEATGQSAEIDYLELARAQSENLEEHDDAIATLERGIAHHAEARALFIALGSQLVRAGLTQDGLTRLRSVIEEHPTWAEAWRELARALYRVGEHDSAILAVSALKVLRRATEQERVLLVMRHQEDFELHSSSMDAVSLLTLGDESPEHYATLALSAATAPILADIFADDGVEAPPGTRLAPGSDHPLRTCADTIANCLGMAPRDYTLYLDPGAASHHAHLVRTQPPGICVAPDLVRQSEAEQVFLLTEALCLIRRGLQCVGTLESTQLQLLLAATTQCLLPELAPPATGKHSETLRTLSAKVDAALDTGTRTRLLPMARAFANRRSTMEAFESSVTRTSRRIAALLADDLGTALRLSRSRREERSPTIPLPSPELLNEDPIARDLLTFWLSEAAVSARQRIGLLPTATNKRGSSDSHEPAEARASS